MLIRLKADVSVLEGRVRNAPKRIAFAVVNAINATIKLAQRAVQLHAEDIFSIRKKEFIRRQVAIIKPFASVGQGRVFAEISVGQKSRLLLSRFEKGGIREPFKGHSVAVPVLGGARPSIGSSVPEELYISKLGFRRQPAKTFRAGHKLTSGGGAGGQRAWLGKLGTYLVPGVGIFQRIGAAAARILYVFATGVRLRPVLNFVSIVHGVVTRNFPRLMREEIGKALEFARRR